MTKIITILLLALVLSMTGITGQAFESISEFEAESSIGERQNLNIKIEVVSQEELNNLVKARHIVDGYNDNIN